MTTDHRHVFQLTAMETIVANHIAAGRAPVAIAKSLGRSHETIRTHLKHVFDKTGTHRQNELTALLLRTSAAVLALAVIIHPARAEPVCTVLPENKQASCDLADACLSKTRRFNDTFATVEAKERFIGHCILQGEIRRRRDP